MTAQKIASCSNPLSGDPEGSCEIARLAADYPIVPFACRHYLPTTTSYANRSIGLCDLRQADVGDADLDIGGV